MAGSDNITLRHPLQPDLYQEYVVASRHLREVMDLVRKVAAYDASVLIGGESGVGKELLARIIHQLSPRRDRSFIPVNCGSLSGDLFESKLFGHEAGAFTGAHRQSKGRFEQAHLGTLFLDEVSEISKQNQVNFLRVLEDGWFRRIGGQKPIKADVRIIAATNKDLALEVREGNFRKDLYYRLHVAPIRLAPLRERREAIPHFVNHFLERLSILHNKPRMTVSEPVMRLFVDYHWPGNVRQLKNFMERLFITAGADEIRVEHLPPDFMSGQMGRAEEEVEPPAFPDQVGSGSRGVEPLRLVRERAEREMIVRALRETDGDRARTAELLEIKPRTLRQKMSDYSIAYKRKSRKAQPEEDS